MNAKNKLNNLLMKFRSLPKRYYTAEKESEAHIWSLRGFVLILALIIIGCLYANSKMPDEILLYDVPSLETGSTRKIKDIPIYAIYSETLYLWQSINRADNLSIDYLKNVNVKYSAYIKPEFREQLTRSFKRKSSSKTNISRRITEIDNINWNDKNRVIRLSQRKWVVYLDINMVERLNNQIVRNANFRYPILVERVEFDPEMNPTGLELVGYYAPVTRLGENK